MQSNKGAEDSHVQRPPRFSQISYFLKQDTDLALKATLARQLLLRSNTDRKSFGEVVKVSG